MSNIYYNVNEGTSNTSHTLRTIPFEFSSVTDRTFETFVSARVSPTAVEPTRSSSYDVVYVALAVGRRQRPRDG